jgi:hypothetical protein
MSDGSFPHERPESESPPAAEPEGARVLDFPTDEVTGPSSAVPAGTWADDDGDVPEHLVRPAKGETIEGGQVVEFPRRPGTHKRRRPRRLPAAGDPGRSQSRLKDASGTQPTQPPAPAEPPAMEPEEPERPEFLASELLEQDWWPRAPLKRTLRWGSIGVGVVGAGLAVALGGLEGPSLGVAALFALCAAAGAAPLGPPLRGAALALVATAGASWVGWRLAEAGDLLATPLLMVCATLSASALFFRAAHRTSKLARVLAGLGLFATAGWLVLAGGLDSMVVESLHWQDWVEPVSHALLGLVALLAVLSFLDPTGHGGAWIAGSAFLAWLALDAAGTSAVMAWPVRPGAGGLDWSAGTWVALAALPLFCALAAGGLCQVWVMLSSRLHGSTPSETA